MPGNEGSCLEIASRRNRAGPLEVVVVVSGTGGLTAAAMLANRGIRVLVIEQHYIPGGCCTCIRRKDMTFDVGVRRSSWAAGT